MNYGPQNQGPGNSGTTKGVEKIVEESDLVQSQHFLTIVIASSLSICLIDRNF